MNLKNIYILSFLMLAYLTGSAQGRPGGENFREKLRAQKVAYLTSKVDLTQDEAIKFWPVFFQYEKELYSERIEFLDDVKLSNISDADADQKLNSFLEYKEKQLRLERKYIVKFKEILPSAKVLKIMHYDNEFRRELLERIKRRVDRKE